MQASKTNRIALYISALIIIMLVLFAILRDNAQYITLAKAKTMLQEKHVEKIVATKKYVYLKSHNGYYKIASSQVTPKMFINYKVEVGSESHILIFILIVVIILGLGSLALKIWQKKEGFHITSKGIIKDVNESQIQRDSGVVEAIKSDVSFDDIGGISDVKIELEEIIDFMKNSKRYKDFGARMPRGVLLIGPPGVGKTMIAKAVAYEAGVAFYYQSGASFVQIYVGMGAKRVHELFLAAKKNAPSIIFIDEIDAVGKKRDGSRNDEREATLNQLLTEMDGFEGSSGVIVIAATNKIEVLDSALLRAGRFDRRVFVELPTKQERESIINKYLQKIPHIDLDVHAISNMTVGFNGAALATLVNEAALLALRESATHVNIEHFYQVKEKVIFGKKKLQMLNDRQKEYRITYQAAKALVASYFDITFEKLMLSNEKLTPTTDEPFNKKELESRIKMLLAGMVACDIKYGEHSNSVKEDLAEAKEIVQKMSNEYGMGTSLLPQESEAQLMLKALYIECESLLQEKKELLQKVEVILLEKESILKVDVLKLLNNTL